MKEVDGDLIDMADNGDFDVIIHGCNCFCTFGAGIAYLIKQKYPNAYEVDCFTKKGDSNKLGTISSSMNETKEGKPLVVVNGYTQFHWSKVNGDGKLQPAPRGTVLVNYDAIRGIMKEVKKKFSGKRIGYPLIGAGLARGDWKVIAKIIEEELDGENHTLVRFKKRY